MSQVEFRTNWPTTATPRASSSWPIVSWAFQINLGLSQKTLHYWKNKPRLYRSLQSTGEPQTALWFSSTPRGMCADLWICGTGTHRWVAGLWLQGEWRGDGCPSQIQLKLESLCPAWDGEHGGTFLQCGILKPRLLSGGDCLVEPLCLMCSSFLLSFILAKPGWHLVVLPLI